MQLAESTQDTTAWPVGTPSRYGPFAGMIHTQTRLEFRAHDGQPDAVETLLHPANRAERLRLARAIGHAAHCLREEEGLSNDVVNLYPSDEPLWILSRLRGRLFSFPGRNSDEDTEDRADRAGWAA